MLVPGFRLDNAGPRVRGSVRSAHTTASAATGLHRFGHPRQDPDGTVAPVDLEGLLDLQWTVDALGSAVGRGTRRWRGRRAQPRDSGRAVSPDRRSGSTVA